MALFDFVKDVGEKLFGAREAKAAPASTPAASGSGTQAAPAGGLNPDAEGSSAVLAHIRGLQLAPPDLTVAFDSASGRVTLGGTAPDQATRERIVLAAGNVSGVGQVDDRMTVARPEPEARFYTVQKGDTLSKIAKAQYGDASRYQAIFEANRPMLTDPDKIYPGQVLRIPAQS